MTLAFRQPDVEPASTPRAEPLARGWDDRRNGEATEPLGGVDVRRGLVALLRRRVPRQDVEDLTQTVLCDALAARTPPSDPEELRKWLSGIARHKVADFHRRAARSRSRSTSEVPDALAGPSAALEEREILRELVNEPRTRRDAETMDWLVREHAGERLIDIAEEHGISPLVVRQRVSRLRRALRSRWTGLFALLALAGGAAALALSTPSDRAAIAPDPVVEATRSASPAEATLGSELAGDWVVQTVTPGRPLSPTEKQFVDAEARSMRLHVEGGGVDLRSRSFQRAWRVATVEELPRKSKASGERSFRVRLEPKTTSKDQARSRYTAEITLRRDDQGPRLDILVRGGPRLGTDVTVSLRRANT